jgi:DNA-3-methyladenine glycosylase
LYNNPVPDFQRLGIDLYNRPVLEAARLLLGMRLVRQEGGRRLAGVITETEAYGHEEDQGCHCRRGRTARTQVMYGPPGRAYVYFNYGMHWLFNVVVEPEGLPAAVLVRSLFPVEGVPEMVARRSSKAGRSARGPGEAVGEQPPGLRPPFDYRGLTGGPARLCQALGITGALNGADLCSPTAEVFIELGEEIPEGAVTLSPRVGLNTVAEPWKSLPWNFRVEPDYLQNLELFSH